jgi:GT2 family glycosyltransferase
MAIDVVVVNYHNDDLLRGFVNSFGEHSTVRDTLTVVDVEMVDHVGDGEWDGVPYHYIGMQGNVGYAKACNAGAQEGTNDVILLANADTLLSDGLQDCHDALLSHDDWGVLGPRQVNEQGRITAGGIFGTETSIGQRGWNEPDNGQYSDVREDAKSVSGSLYFIKRSVWNELTQCQYMQGMFPGITGAFIPTQHYYEETCCSYHARNHGYKVVYYGPVRMVHYWHRASDHGGWADMQVGPSKALMRLFLASHGIDCE